MKNAFTLLILATCIVSLVSCEEEKKSSNKFKDDVIQRIYNLCDERKAAELGAFYNDANEQYRAEAALAFASIADSAEAVRLLPFLADASALVRINAAYALGQCANPSMTNIIKRHYLEESDKEVAANLLDSYGKIVAEKLKSGSVSDIEKELFFLDSIRFDSEWERIGWAKAAMAIHMAGLTDPVLVKRVPYLLQNAEHESKVQLAFSMLRYKGPWDDTMKKYLDSWLKTERDVEAKIPMVAMIPKLETAEVPALLVSYATSASFDTRVRVNAIRAMGKVKSISLKSFQKIVTDSDPVLVAEALNVIRNVEDKQGLEELMLSITLSTAEIQSLKLRILDAVTDQSEVLWSTYASALNPYDRMHFARALGACPELNDRVFKAMMAESTTVVKCALAEAYVEMSGHKNWPVEVDFVQLAISAIQGGDVGVVAIFATALREKKHSEEDNAKISTACQGVLSKLVLPREIETYNELVRTIQATSTAEIVEKKTEFNHGIDWNYARGIDPKHKVRITTTKGDIDLQLHVENAPGTVVSFLKLTEEGFYNGRFFHRVIPNFVAQGGCPRGDGWGSTDYSLRSEFGLHNYAAGAVGVASSGHDTEGSQWFITLSPAPHLDGRYTIFADVVSGLDVAQRLVVGDGIIKIEMLK